MQIELKASEKPDNVPPLFESFQWPVSSTHRTFQANDSDTQTCSRPLKTLSRSPPCFHHERHHTALHPATQHCHATLNADKCIAWRQVLATLTRILCLMVAIIIGMFLPEANCSELFRDMTGHQSAVKAAARARQLCPALRTSATFLALAQQQCSNASTNAEAAMIKQEPAISKPLLDHPRVQRDASGEQHEALSLGCAPLRHRAPHGFGGAAATRPRAATHLANPVAGSYEDCHPRSTPAYA